MTNMLTAAAAMSESPLIRYLAAIGLVWLGFKAVLFIADVVIDDMVNEAALAVSLDLAQTDNAELPDPDPFDWSAETLHAWADPFAQTRQQIRALDTFNRTESPNA